MAGWIALYNAAVRALRHSPTLSRLILAWFVLVLGVAGASPLIQPKTLQAVCTAAGMVSIVFTGEGSTPPSSTAAHTLDCALCLPAVVPTTATSLVATSLHFLTDAARPPAAVHAGPLAAAPLPARGPPSLA